MLSVLAPGPVGALIAKREALRARRVNPGSRERELLEDLTLTTARRIFLDGVAMIIFFIWTMGVGILLVVSDDLAISPWFAVPLFFFIFFLARVRKGHKRVCKALEQARALDLLEQ